MHDVSVIIIVIKMRVLLWAQLLDLKQYIKKGPEHKNNFGSIKAKVQKHLVNLRLLIR